MVGLLMFPPFVASVRGAFARRRSETTYKGSARRLHGLSGDGTSHWSLNPVLDVFRHQTVGVARMEVPARRDLAHQRQQDRPVVLQVEARRFDVIHQEGQPGGPEQFRAYTPPSP